MWLLASRWRYSPPSLREPQPGNQVFQIPSLWDSHQGLVLWQNPRIPELWTGYGFSLIRPLVISPLTILTTSNLPPLSCLKPRARRPHLNLPSRFLHLVGKSRLVHPQLHTHLPLLSPPHLLPPPASGYRPNPPHRVPPASPGTLLPSTLFSPAASHLLYWFLLSHA